MRFISKRPGKKDRKDYKHTLIFSTQRGMWSSGVRKGHNVNHAGLILLLCLNLCWLSDTHSGGGLLAHADVFDL